MDRSRRCSRESDSVDGDRSGPRDETRRVLSSTYLRVSASVTYEIYKSVREARAREINVLAVAEGRRVSGDGRLRNW